VKVARPSTSIAEFLFSDIYWSQKEFIYSRKMIRMSLTFSGDKRDDEDGDEDHRLPPSSGHSHDAVLSRTYATHAVRYPIFHEHVLQTNALFFPKSVLLISYSHRQFRDRRTSFITRPGRCCYAINSGISICRSCVSNSSSSRAISRMSLGTWRNATKLKCPRR